MQKGLAKNTFSLSIRFENDVKEYGFQASIAPVKSVGWFENDVKEYGFQADVPGAVLACLFENDVKE